MLNLEYTNQFKKDIKKITKQGLDSKRHCTFYGTVPLSLLI